MANHPNRGKRHKDAPAPEDVRALRESLGLSKGQAAALVHAPAPTWAAWERPLDDPQARPMHAGLWELFRLKARTIVNRERLEVLIDKASPPRAFVRITADGWLELYAPDGAFTGRSAPTPDGWTAIINSKGWTA